MPVRLKSTVVAPLLMFALGGGAAFTTLHTAPAAAEPSAGHGEYLVTVGGCNDCHTPGWNEHADTVPKSAWLVGSPVGWRGPWGTSYPANLRLIPQQMDEDGFVEMMRTRKDRPPMPWPNVNRMREDDLRSIYRFLGKLGPTGKPMPDYVAPDAEPATPYIPATPVAPAAKDPK